MPEELPKFIDLRRASGPVMDIAGTIASTRLERITTPYKAYGPLTVTMQVFVDDQQQRRARGEVETELRAICQRCLADMPLVVKKDFDVELIVMNEGTALPSDDHDFATITEGRLDIEQFAEDEVILACPMIPLHDDERCRRRDSQEPSLQTERKKPFADLAALLNKPTE